MVFTGTPVPRSTLSDAVARGELQRLGRGLYTRDISGPPEEVVRRRLYEVVAALFPGAVLSDRTAYLGGKPAPDGQLFLTHARTGDVALPGLLVRAARGAGPIEGDLPFPYGLHLSSTARALLENARPSRGRGGRVARTLTRVELEEWLETLLEQRGDDGLRRLREEARAAADPLGLQTELEEIDSLMGAVLGTRRVRAKSERLRARQRGRPYDAERLELFTELASVLEQQAPVTRVVSDEARHRFLPFFEAYFSNFIEGTEFALSEAAEIVFENKIPPQRPKDAHDILGTYRLVADNDEMTTTPQSADDLLTILRTRHARMLGERPEARPGEFKTEKNRVGAVEFVDPSLVDGTLRRGFDLYSELTSPFARAVFQMFIVAEVHPFDDGNGRIARVMMNAELSAAREQRIIIPQVYRNNYLMGLRAMTVNRRADALIRMLDFAQRYTAGIDFSSYESAVSELAETNAFLDPLEADEAGVRLVLHAQRGQPWRVVSGPKEYVERAGADIDIGWAYEVARGNEQRRVAVEVAGGRMGSEDLPSDARQAVATRGFSALSSHLEDEQPPRRLLVTTAGVAAIGDD